MEQFLHLGFVLTSIAGVAVTALLFFLLGKYYERRRMRISFYRDVLPFFGTSNTKEDLKQEAERRAQEFSRLGALIQRAVQAATGGKTLKKQESLELSLWIRGEEWFKRDAFLVSEEEKVVKAQTMLLGRDLRKALRRVANDGQFTKEDRIELGQWLGSISRARGRYRLKLTMYAICAVAVLVALGFLWVLLSVRTKLNDTPTTMPFMAAFAVLSIALIKDIILDRSVETALNEAKATSEKARQDINETIEKNLRPRIIPLDTREKVVKAACDILQEATKETDDNKFVIFVGAASLSTDQMQTADEDSTPSPEAEYRIRLNSLEHNKVSVKRYIALIEDKEIPIRQEDMLKRYEPWLKKQLDLLENNNGYVLKHCLRAQPYEGSRSSIMTNKAVLDIVGYGDSGFLIKDEELARTIRESSEDLFNSKATIRETYWGGSENVESRIGLWKLYNAVRSRKKRK